ncbi:hypothetical protein [Carboxylicivirga taeanensis]|uniref:hypothetical protein n=1 Tax=Carboxylicivirga taeanensis TaxID=1416875 RepID=UPI003F6E238B
MRFTSKNIKKTIGAAIMLAFCNLTLIAQEEKSSPELELGGALRFNYNYSSWKEGQKDRGGDFGFDVFRLNAKAKYKGLKLNAEYRFYSSGFGGAMLKQGWVGYDFNENNNLQLGLTQVPFGLSPYNSNSWFFSLNYYIGLEDDHDMGIKYTTKSGNWDINLAFFKNAEEMRFGSSTDADPNRYSYDIGSIADNENMAYRNKEVNQINARFAYNIGEGAFSQQIGFSGEYGGLYNLDTKKSGDRYAVSGHYRLNANKFGLKAAATYYKMNPEHPEGQDDRLVAMVAYGAAYMVAAEAATYTLGVSYSVPVDWNPISNVTFYNDFGYMDKAEKDFEDTLMNVTGVMVTSGSIYTYVDYAMGKNQPWLGPEWTHGLGAGNPDAEWEARFNINIGYYF